ncbi:hypothetical protein [Prosthecobacter fluviatilis]|uniref:Uncharacterized protein n=1 Tax=Prosthecobacter fluviatilis TaxID=445931 RepID=A0ABW0KLH3_9BACT
MRGFPPIQIFLLVLAFVVLAIPLSILTGTTTPVKAAELKKMVEEKSVKGLVRVRYAHRPVTLSVKIGEKEVISSVEESPMEVDAPLPSTKDGVDVFVKATWPEGTPDTAVTVELEPDGLATRSETRWSSAASLDEVITFEWK